MARFAYDKKKGESVKVSAVDTTSMLTLTDILPSTREFSAQYIIKKKKAPDIPARDIYHTRDNAALLRKVFNECLKIVLTSIIRGECQFIVPLKGRTNPKIYVGKMNDKAVRAKVKAGELGYVNMFATDYTVPYLRYQLSSTSHRQPLYIYVNKKLYFQLINHANQEGHYSVRPRTIDHFLPQLFEKFYYLQQKPLAAFIKFCWAAIHKEIKYGNEIRFIDGDGEIRFFRALGASRPRIMRAVVKQRLTRERKKRYESFDK